jgi:hypothetical protein
MAIFNINTKTLDIKRLEEYHFRSEGNDRISPQELIAKFPEIIVSIPELEIPPCNSILVIREYSTSRGSIDLLMITENSDILLIETKLYRNPESHRTVVAQAIDYVKSFTDTDLDTLRSSFLRSRYSDTKLAEALFSRDDFCIPLNKNIKNGYFKVLIIGDKIHPNLLGMIDSIHSAPHLAYTIYLLELSPIKYDENNILLEPRIIENTNEIERSVIRLEIDYKKETYTIESSSPVKDSKGSRPIITDEQYINSLSNPEFAETIKSFWNKWKSIDGDIRFGTVGFSCGFEYGDKRIPMQFVMNNRVDLISDNYRKTYDIPDNVYKVYKESLKFNVPKAFDHLVANHVAMQFESITKDDLENILVATVELIKEMKGNLK